MTLTLSTLIRILILATISRLFERTLELFHQLRVGLLHLLSELLPTEREKVSLHLEKLLEHLRLQKCIEATAGTRTTGTALALFSTLSSHGVAH